MRNCTHVEKVSDCDLCRMAGIDEIARFDAKLQLGPWGNLCKVCWMKSCQRALGTGIGQMLTRPGESVAEVSRELGIEDLI